MTSPDSPSPRTEAGTCWFCRREVPWATLIAGYDTWDEQRLACPSCDRSVRWLRGHGWNLSRAANEADAQSTFDRATELVRAAQEAPAPDGLLQNPWASPTSEFDRAEDVLAGMLSLQRLRGRLSKVTVSDVRALLAAVPKPAPPSPAEPPRPDHQHHYEHDFRCGTCGATFLAVLTDDRAEARPPEGLDPDRLAGLLNDAENEALGTNFERPSLRQQKVAAALAARLSARGAEPILAIEREAPRQDEPSPASAGDGNGQTREAGSRQGLRAVARLVDAWNAYNEANWGTRQKDRAGEALGEAIVALHALAARLSARGAEPR